MSANDEEEARIWLSLMKFAGKHLAKHQLSKMGRNEDISGRLSAVPEEEERAGLGKIGYYLKKTFSKVKQGRNE
uniref:Lycosin 9i 3k n=1 Tax=Lycosa hispanica TaxID=1296364 RepID=A0A8D8EPN3_9ARAC|nr:Lycosin 9i 3k precursor [Lycosa hispanica]